MQLCGQNLLIHNLITQKNSKSNRYKSDTVRITPAQMWCYQYTQARQFVQPQQMYLYSKWVHKLSLTCTQMFSHNETINRLFRVQSNTKCISVQLTHAEQDYCFHKFIKY